MAIGLARINDIIHTLAITNFEMCFDGLALWSISNIFISLLFKCYVNQLSRLVGGSKIVSFTPYKIKIKRIEGDR